MEALNQHVDVGVESTTSPRRVRGRDRQLQALELRTRGLTFEAIGRRLGVSTQAAHATVSRALSRSLAQSNASANELRALELTRLDAMLAALWCKIEEGDVPAINAALRISERRAKLTGLDTPSDKAGPALTLADIFARPMPKDARGWPILTREPTQYDEEVMRGAASDDDEE